MKRRTKIATILTTGLLSAALVGVGFAAWTITNTEGSAEKSQTGGNVNVDAEVVDLNLSEDDITIAEAGDKHDIYYSIKEASAGDQSGKWLTNNETVNYENLKVQYTITLAKANVAEIQIEFKAPTVGWAAAKTSNYVADPTYTLSENNTYEIKGNANKITLKDGQSAKAETLTLTIEFHWGTYFDGTNPYDLFAGTTYGQQMSEAFTSEHKDTLGSQEGKVEDYAKTGIQGLNGITGTFSFTLKAYSTAQP